MRNYKCFAVKEQGFNHIKSGLVCQDSADHFCSGNIKCIAVADGHGSRQYFRSDRGSGFAVSCALESLYEFSVSLTADFMKTEKEMNGRICQLINSIITKWHLYVKNDLEKCPFEKSELENVPEKYRKAYESGAGIERAYGSTLICAADNGEYSIGLHIGDGRCVAVYDDGTADEPIPWDESCHLNQCTSICDDSSTSEFRFYVWREKRPIAFIICSDGIDDSYGRFLHSFCKSVLLELSEGDFRENVSRFRGKLPQISQNGSKDDVAVAGMIDVDKVNEIRPVLETDIKCARTERELIDINNKKNDLVFLCGKAERIYEKCRISGAEEAEITEKMNKYLSLKRELENAVSLSEKLEKRRSELLEHRRICISGQHTALYCPECGHKIRIALETEQEGNGYNEQEKF